MTSFKRIFRKRLAATRIAKKRIPTESIRSATGSNLGATTNTKPIIELINYSTAIYRKRGDLDVQRDVSSQTLSAPKTKYAEDIEESSMLHKIDMGFLVVGVMGSKAKEMEPKLASLLKRYFQDSPMSGPLYLTDLRKDFDTDIALALIALLSHYGWFNRESEPSRNPGVRLTEKGESMLFGHEVKHKIKL